MQYNVVQIISLCCGVFVVPPPVVSVKVDPAVDPIYSSTALNLTCIAELAEEVDTITMAVASWTGPTGTGDLGQQPTDSNRISVLPAVRVGERMFESILLFDPIDFEEDSGLHICNMNISSNTTLSLEDALILDSMKSGNTNISVKGE